ncbi:MAG TPA: helix-turn-helix transcriptional regulator [Saprospiraceae bacterium]|nr:helix-turn-helix transcriptional regulator [Saprospiraceae bacterium]
MGFQSINSTILTKSTNELAFKLTSFKNLDVFDHLVRYNYYSIILIEKGGFQLKIDLDTYDVLPETTICLSPYQPFMMTSNEETVGYMLNFHPDFFCTYRHQNEIETEGVLFNNFSSEPFFSVNNISKFIGHIHNMNSEIKENGIGIHEVLISSLKIFLIILVREKRTFDKTNNLSKVNEKPALMQSLVDSIEKNYKSLHTAGDYAKILFATPQQLNKVVKSNCNISVSQMIVNRIMIEAKRELYLTSKAVKEISGDLGYKDEFYFSRVFKKQVGVSPKLYRDTVGFAKME